MNTRLPATEKSLEGEIGELLRQRGLRLATAESCTGGLVGHRVTNIPGSSDYYLGGITAYSNEAKQRLLGVQPGTLQAHGAVSRDTVLEMAQGARRVVGAEIGVSVSGVAGPGGGTPGKPVGLVWIGLSTPQGDWAIECLFHGSRVENKEASAQAALQLVVDYLRGELNGTS